MITHHEISRMAREAKECGQIDVAIILLVLAGEMLYPDQLNDLRGLADLAQEHGRKRSREIGAQLMLLKGNSS